MPAPDKPLTSTPKSVAALYKGVNPVTLVSTAAKSILNFSGTPWGKSPNVIAAILKSHFN